MAVGGGKPVLGGIDPFSGEPFEIVLEDELIQDFELHTLVKPTVENYNEYSQRYNMICKDIQETGNERFLGEIIDLRYAARRQNGKRRRHFRLFHIHHNEAVCGYAH